MELDIERARLEESDEIEIDETTAEVTNGDQISTFLSGVIEGFYGSPWLTCQREHLIRTLDMLALNAYIYAPKNDKKHRKYWRKLHTSKECENLSTIVNYAKAHNIHFIYSISPGLDIIYSAIEDRNALKAKFQQVSEVGVCGFGLFFDDIDPKLDERDSQLYEHYADAQADLANAVYDALGHPDIFLFCPTEYCTSRAKPTLSSSIYLRTLGANLHENIMVMWTGPRVVSRSIPYDHIRDIVSVLKRKPVIWDNLYANDYDQRQIFLGPYQRRPLAIHSHISGLFLNPNCQYDLNFIPIYTFAFWIHAAEERQNNTENTDELSDSPHYRPEKAFLDAGTMWLDEFRKTFPAPGTVQEESESDGSMSSNSTDSSYAPEHTTLTRNDICRVCSFMYLPGQFGSFATSILTQFKRLKATSSYFWKNSGGALALNTDHSEERRRFKQISSKTLLSFKRLRTSQNEVLLSAILPFVDEVKDAVQSMRAFSDYLEMRERKPAVDELFSDPDCLLNRGRFATEVQKLLPSVLFGDPLGDLAEQPPVYVVRPPNDQDKERLERVCYSHLTHQFGVWDDLRPARRICNLRYLESFFRAPHEMHVVEDADGLCGYMLHKVVLDMTLDERLHDEYQALLLEHPSLSDGVPESFTALPAIVPTIIREFPLKVFFCFQVGFKKGHVVNKLVDILIQRVRREQLSGVHLVLDAFEMIEPTFLKRLNFKVHPAGESHAGKYYVLDVRE